MAEELKNKQNNVIKVEENKDNTVKTETEKEKIKEIGTKEKKDTVIMYKPKSDTVRYVYGIDVFNKKEFEVPKRLVSLLRKFGYRVKRHRHSEDK